MTPKEAAFHEDMLAIYEKSRDEMDYRPTRFLSKVERDGGVAAAKYWLKKRTISAGFTRLQKAGKLNLSVESLVLRPEYKLLFSTDQRKVALERLIEHGWNPGGSVWIFQAVPEQYDIGKELHEGHDDWWRVTRYWKEVKKGDKVIFWLGGMESGIYGVGELTSDPYPSKAHQGPHKFSVDLKYTHKFAPPILKDALKKHPVLKKLSILKPPFQASNFRATIEQWNALGVFDDVHADEVEAPLRYPEGATVQRTVNAYERNPQARWKCLEYYGCRCSVCLTDFEAKYGPLGRACVHVHHLKKMSEIHQEYEVDPVKDLRPVCPNCHAMIHWKGQMRSIDDLGALIRKTSAAR